MSKQEDFGRSEKSLEKTQEINNEARISKRAKMKRKFNRNQKRVTLWDIQLSSLTSLGAHISLNEMNEKLLLHKSSLVSRDFNFILWYTKCYLFKIIFFYHVFFTAFNKLLLKKLQNHTLHIILLRSLFCLIRVDVGWQFFWITSFSSFCAFYAICFEPNVLNQGIKICVVVILKGASCYVIFFSCYKKSPDKYQTICKNSTM